MEVTLIPLSCDHRSKALSISFSAIEALRGSVLVRMCSHRPRMLWSRINNWEPSLTDFLNSAIRSVRACQLLTSGVNTNLSPASSTTPAMAAMARTCWRFLTFIGASWFPAKVERKLQGGWFAAHGIGFQIGNFPGRLQLGAHLQPGLVVMCHTGASHG